MRGKVKKFVSVNIPDYGNLRIVLLENGIILNSDNTYFQHRGTDLTIFEALCKIGFPVSIENIKLVQKALGETIYIVKFHKSSICNDHKWTNASALYLDTDYCVCHCELNFHHKIGNKVYFVHDNATMTMNNYLFNKNHKPEIVKHTNHRIFNSKFLRVSDGITDDYWEVARLAQRIYDRENVDESLPDENIEIYIDRDHEADGILCARITGNKGDIIIRKDISENHLIFSATTLDLNTHQETVDSPIDPIDYLNKIGIRNAKNVGTILKGLGVTVYHILQFPSCETRFAEDYEGIRANEDCIKRNYSISIYDTTERWNGSNYYGYDFSESVEAISPVRDYDHTLYFSILEPSNIHVFMPEDMYFPYRIAIEKFRKEDPEMSGGTVYLNTSDPRAYAVFFDK